ncbi:MAG: hypothetical protein M3371_14765 [Acidobacteriota bacterium]|nr:hypothetical protein [Acidobacteriota bacterium]
MEKLTREEIKRRLARLAPDDLGAAAALARQVWGACSRKTEAARRLEAEGPEVWLRRLGGRTFTGSFSQFHRELWAWYWAITMKRLTGAPLAEDELVFLAIWFRGGGKSSHVEWACIAEGALLGEGYVMYVSDTEAQARGHVAAIRKRLESSEIASYYPGLGQPELGKHGRQVGWRQDYLATASGWGIIPVGLDQGIRGGRKDDLRFTLIVLDDIDDIKDSPAAVQKKLDIISRSILPAGQRDTLVLFAQNLIHDDSVLNQIVTRRSDVLSQRRVSGPVPAFTQLELRDQTTERGLVWEIASAQPSWPDIDMEAAGRYLAKSGRASFLAEYQHDFAADRAELVLSNWRDDVHVITWSEFAAVFGVRRPPARWYKYVGHDWARTKSQYHANVAGIVSVSGMNEPLPGFVFLHDCMSFEAGTEADDVALRLLQTVAPAGVADALDWEGLIRATLTREHLERYVAGATALVAARREAIAYVIPPLVATALAEQNYVTWRMSHERTDLRQLYEEVYGLPFEGVNPGRDGGIETLNHYLQVEVSAPHPFRPGQRGFTRFFLVVADERAAYPADVLPDKLHDSDLARYQFAHWRHVPLRLTEAGVIERGAKKENDDFGQMLQMLFFDNGVRAAPLTDDERRLAQLPDYLRPAEVMAHRGRPDFVELYGEQQNTLHQIKLREEREREEEQKAWGRFLGRPVQHRRYRGGR